MPHLERKGPMAMGSKQGDAEAEQMDVKPEQVDETQTGEDLSNSATTGAERCALIHVRVDAIRPAHPPRHP